MFEALKSRYITGGLADSCNYSSPFAAPLAIFIMVFQSKAVLLGAKSVDSDKTFQADRKEVLFSCFRNSDFRKQMNILKKC